MEIFYFELENKKKIPAELYAYAANKSTLCFRIHYLYEKMRICWGFFYILCCIRITCRSIISLQLLSEAEYDLSYAYRGLDGVRSRRRITTFEICIILHNTKAESNKCFVIHSFRNTKSISNLKTCLSRLCVIPFSSSSAVEHRRFPPKIPFRKLFRLSRVLLDL